MQIRITDSAEADLLNGFAFYERQQQGIGEYFLDSLYADIDSLALFGGIHPKPDGRLHRTLSKRFPFAIYYDVQMRNQRPRTVPVNAVWAMDLTFYTDTSGKQHMALGILDHGSRLVTCLQTLANKRSWTLLGYLCLAIGRHGKPGRIRTDNEVVFTSFMFTTFLKLVGIRHQRIQTCAPWQNGRIECLSGTLKPLLRQLVIPSKAALQVALEEFTLFYNHARPHQNLDGLTPAQKWNGWSKTDLLQMPPKRAVLVQALDGLLVGYCMRR